MKLHSPFIITSRLMPGLRIPSHGKLAEISIEFDGETSDGRARYRYYIDSPDFEYTDNDLKSGVGGGTLQEGMESLLSFLGAAAGHPADDTSLFPKQVMEWAYQHSDELSMLQMDLEENKDLIID